MSYRLIFGLMLVSITIELPATSLSTQRRQQEITPSPAGPFHVAGNRIVDSQGRPFLMKGTQLTEFHAETTAQDNHSGLDFGPHSPTSLSAIRLRFNMNTVRLPVNILESTRPGYFAELAKVVHRATDIDLLVVIAGRADGVKVPPQKSIQFWSLCAAEFKDSPNVMFEVFGDSGVDVSKKSAAEVVRAIRSAGAAQTVILPVRLAGADDANIVYAVSSDYASADTERLPLLANGLDLNLEDQAQCSTVPSDPGVASAMLQNNLNYFDAHGMSWIVSEYRPGKLIKDWSLQDATSLENGWTCGKTVYPPPGIGRLIEAHLRATEERGMFIVSAGGGPDLPRGGFAMAYGPAMASQDSHAPNARRLPKMLGGISVQITDARGVTRPAGILWAHAGWGQVNYVVPSDSAPGPATMTVVRADGSTTVSNITVADTAPGFWTGVSCRGPALGTATQVFADGRVSKSSLSTCKNGICTALPIPVAAGAKTTVELVASGLRYAGSPSDIEVTVGGVRVPVVSFGPSDDEGVDRVILEIPATLRAVGEVDLLCHIHGRVSNAVQVHIGGARS